MLLESGDELKVAQNNKLWEPATGEGKEDGENAQRCQFSGAVLYAAAATKSQLILRRGDVLYAIESSQ